jgi:hypothetical protein
MPVNLLDITSTSNHCKTLYLTNIRLRMINVGNRIPLALNYRQKDEYNVPSWLKVPQSYFIFQYNEKVGQESQQVNLVIERG